MLDLVLIVMLAVLFAAWIKASSRAKRAEESLKHEAAKGAELVAVQQVLEENLRAARIDVSELAASESCSASSSRCSAMPRKLSAGPRFRLRRSRRMSRRRKPSRHEPASPSV